ncbi:hypothetical protein GG344DRAFT_81447 [Lentinula edodes]|nr:hypothetical protein GG344DRAFT_81447 [Lentinula edodes]
MEHSTFWPGYDFPTYDASVSRVEKHILDDCATGRLHSVASAFLLGTSCSAPLLVSVPLDLGIDSYLSVDDVYTSSYIYKMAYPTFISCDHQRVYINRFPLDSDSYLPNPFTILFCTQHQGLEVNHFIEKFTVRTAKPSVVWTGNILILKHSRPCSDVAEDGLVDVEADDLRLLKPIVEWLITKRFDIGASYYPRPTPYPVVVPPTFVRYHTVPPHPVLDHRDVREYFFGYCGFKTLTIFSAVNAKLRSHVLLFIASRVRSVLSLVFKSSSVTHFMEFLDRHRSFIIGSAAYQILDPRLHYPLDNINIVAVQGMRSEWLNAMSLLDCIEEDVQPIIRDDTPKFWLDVYAVNCDIFTYRFVSRGL